MSVVTERKLFQTFEKTVDKDLCIFSSGQEVAPKQELDERPKTDKSAYSRRDNKKPFAQGIKVPLLHDFSSRQNIYQPAIKFDIIESVRTIIKPGSFSVFDDKVAHKDASNQKHAAEMPNASIKLENRNLLGSRQHTTHSVRSNVNRDGKEGTVLNKFTSYNWEHKEMSRKGKQDARDVLYKNTYCQEDMRLRFRSLTKLPLIQNERPWTVDEVKNANKTGVMDDVGSAHLVTIVPQTCRESVIRFSEHLRPSTFRDDRDLSDLKRINSMQQQSKLSKLGGMPKSASSSQMNYKAKKIERPMKFEHHRFMVLTRNFRKPEYSFNVGSQPSDKQSRSQHSFEDYLLYLKQMAAHPSYANNIKLRTDQRYNNGNLDSDTHMLQSVDDVNNPRQQERDIPVFIPTQENRGITVEIKPSWIENSSVNDHVDEPRSGDTCPANTPIPLVEEE
ncbi:hypothetical protein CHS0354_016788 [Potamilus streckersoni]|uniref:Uncharacterized protein n=1 Tax=Potamilus streckersoni TaxID=2493646 RepID=A0AAE0T387_9BIVA|nr:hypothetical protein CHS0354_016788 [Potamilus streckersoni]